MDGVLYRGNKTLMPICVATYDRGHEQCDGEPRGKTEIDRMPCVFRDRCVAMGFYGRENRLEREQLIQIVKAKPKGGVQKFAIAAGDDGELQSALITTIDKYRIKDGISASAPSVTGRGARPASLAGSAAIMASRPVVASAPKPTGASSSKSVGIGPNIEGRRIVEELAEHFQSVLLNHLKRTIAPSRGEAQAGQLFVVDRRDKSGYSSLYCKGDDGGRIAVVAIHFRPNNAALEVRVAADFRQFSSLFSAANKVRVKPEDITGRDGFFKVKFARLGRLELGLIAEALGRATDGGILDLPAPA